MVNDILDYLNVDKVELLTENPDKITVLGSKVVSTKGIIITSELKYLKDKRDYFKSLLDSQNMSKTTPDFEIIKTNRSHKVGIVYSSWHSSYVVKIRDILKGYLNEYGIKDISEYEVPGSNEIPFIASKIAKNVDGIICVGILIKGDTLHFENVSTAVSNGIMQAQIQTGIPMMNVILSCFNFEQVEERIDGEKSTLEYIVKGLIKVMEI
jgi:6,7-dimethyl-8-ribityllumazine synthase